MLWMMHWHGALDSDCRLMYLAEAVMSDDAVLLKLEEDYTCPITQACLLISIQCIHCHFACCFAWALLQLHCPSVGL